MKSKLAIILMIIVFPCIFSCAGTGGQSTSRQIDLFDSEDSVMVDVFEAKPMSSISIDVDARAAAVPFGTDDVLHVGTCHLTDSTTCGFVYVFSLKPESVDTVSSTTLRYHFTLGRKGRVMLMTAKHPEGITEALGRLDARVKEGWIDENNRKH
jgi:hypothetical protein